MGSPETPNWIFDYNTYNTLMDDIAVPGGALPAEVAGFQWNPQPVNAYSGGGGGGGVSVETDVSFGDSDAFKEAGSKKRVRSGACGASGSKACREKMRRDKLNERFLELGSILEPGRPPKIDKAAILTDAVRMVTQLRNESQNLKQSNEDLQEKIKELKSEKNELRDEKQRLKAEKEKLEQQVKAMSSQPSFLPHPPGIPAAYAAQGHAPGNKLMPFIGYPGVAMWQFMPPAAVDTSQDHVLRPPVA